MSDEINFMRTCNQFLPIVDNTIRRYNLTVFYNYIRVFLTTSICCYSGLLTAGEIAPLSSTLHGLEFIAPEDRWAVRMEFRHNDYNRFYNSGRKKEALGAPFDGINLDSNVFADLAAFGAGASLGVTQFSAKVESKRLELTMGYGVTKNLTVGFIVPYGEVTTKAQFSVVGGNIGFNPAFNPVLPAGATNPPLLPVGAGATAPVGTDGVQAILTNPAFGFGYKPLQTTTWHGIGDPTIGLLWRFMKTDVDSFVLGTGFRFGLADDVDIDDLLQLPIDDGNNDYRLRLEYYRDLGAGYDLKLITAYTYQFEDSVNRRVPGTGALLATEASKERVRRKLGNYWEYDVGLAKAIGDWRYSGTWHRYTKEADRYTSALGTDTSELSADTNLYANQWRAAISWSGIHAWQDDRIPLPLIVQLELQETYAAKNFPDVRDIYLQVTSFF